ncbi:hypothetical protein EXIGLDRAFT_761750 [Exidia glandulosa HHB12029]|uniref:DUF6699 domain-containing protein n=1 Tax=Exidia glandulosa HHB12029 TaxID=1314781 RepID=A0A166BES4_EXIGL|nr:hypothetical protein EXIGLDRAFT_761750 [Exidia glandulosa HHB12029]
MYHYYYPPPFYPITPNVSPAGAHVPLPPSPYLGPVPLHAAPPGYDPYAYGVPPYAYPYYAHNALPAAPPPHQYPAHASQLHGLLHYSKVPRLRFDVAKPYEHVTMLNGSQIPPGNQVQPAVLAPTTKMRLVSPGFPWVIDIDTERPTEDDRFQAGSPITVEILLQKLHATLRSRMTSSEWLLCDKTKRTALSAAFKARCGASGKEYENGLCWVDFLTQTHFYGLTKDDKVVSETLVGRKDEIYETWVVIFGPPRR